MSEANINVAQGDGVVEVTVEQLWTELRELGVDEAVRELVNREARTHNAVIERIVTAAGFKRHPGVDALCTALKNRRHAGMTVATLAEGLSGEVTALRRVLANVKGVINPEGTDDAQGLKAQLESAARLLNGSRNVTVSVDLDSVGTRIDRYRRLAGSSLPGSEVG